MRNKQPKDGKGAVKKEKIFSMRIPQELFDELEKVGKLHHKTPVEVLRSYVRLGLLIHSDGGNEVKLKLNGEWQSVILL